MDNQQAMIEQMLLDLGSTRRDYITTAINQTSYEIPPDGQNQNRAAVTPFNMRVASIPSKVQRRKALENMPALQAWNDPTNFVQDGMTATLPDLNDGQGHRERFRPLQGQYNARKEELENKYSEERALYLQERNTTDRNPEQRQRGTPFPQLERGTLGTTGMHQQTRHSHLAASVKTGNEGCSGKKTTIEPQAPKLKPTSPSLHSTKNITVDSRGSTAAKLFSIFKIPPGIAHPATPLSEDEKQVNAYYFAARPLETGATFYNAHPEGKHHFLSARRQLINLATNFAEDPAGPRAIAYYTEFEEQKWMLEVAVKAKEAIEQGLDVSGNEFPATVDFTPFLDVAKLNFPRKATPGNL